MAVDELEFLVQFNRTLCISLPAEDATLSSLKQHLHLRERVPVDRLELLVDGLKLDDSDGIPPTVPVILRARLTHGLLGGKGGFGAMLRSQGKTSGKATTSFGACRDLNGRRLRHVNQEIAMDKWRQESELREQRKKTGVSEREIMDEDTPSGIAGWYLATPSWAEGIKRSYIKRRRNTMLCRNWVQARENGRAPPENAPRWWGCPRGRDCDFAHGEDELRGEGLTEFKRQKKQEQYDKKQQELNRYVNYESEMPSDIRDAIAQGMRHRNSQASKPAAAAAVSVPVAVAVDVGSVPWQWLASADDSVTVTFQHGLCELRGAGNFGTATVPHCQLTRGKWYYEVRLVTDDIIQLGWADSAFTASSVAGDGVGDHAHSWAYDGARQLKWTDGKEEAYGEEWESGDIIGCLLDIDSGEIQFSRNGRTMGTAFTLGERTGFFPAISIEKTEILLVNIGVQPFLYAPEGYQAVAASIATKHEAKQSAPVPAPVAETTVETKPVEVKQIELMDLASYESALALEALGLEVLKQQLHARKLKCGGSLGERAARLFSVKGKSWEEMDPKIKDFKALRK